MQNLSSLLNESGNYKKIEMVKVRESCRFMELNRLLSLDLKDGSFDSMQPEETEIIAFVWKIDAVNFSERSFV